MEASIGNPAAVGQFILNVISGAATGSTDDLTLQNKVAVAGFMTTAVQADGATWTSAIAAESKTVLAATTDASTGAGSPTVEDAAFTAFMATLGYGPNIINLTNIPETYTATVAMTVFNSPGVATVEIPGVNIGLPTNDLVTGDVLNDSFGDGTLNLTIPTTSLLNPDFAGDVTMTGIATVNILALAPYGGPGSPSGFAGPISGIKTINYLGGSDTFQAGAPGGAGLLTAPTTVNIDTFSPPFTDVPTPIILFIAAAAASASNSLSVTLGNAVNGNYGVAGASALSLQWLRDAGSSTAAVPDTSYGTLSITSNAPTPTSGFGAELQLSNNGFSGLATLNLLGATTFAVGSGGFNGAAFFTTTFEKLATINASGMTGGSVTISGASAGGANYQLATNGVATDGFFGALGGLLTGDTALTSFKGDPDGPNFLDVSSLSAAQLAALVATGNTASGVINQIVETNAVVGTTSAATWAGVTNFQQIDIDFTGGATSINAALLPTSVTDLFYLTSATGAVTVTNAPVTFTIDTGDASVGNNLTVTSAAAVDATAMLTVIVGSDIAGIGNIAGDNVIGTLKVSGEATVDISAESTHGLVPDVIDTLTLLPTLAELVNISGNDALSIGNGISTARLLARFSQNLKPAPTRALTMEATMFAIGAN